MNASGVCRVEPAELVACARGSGQAILCRFPEPLSVADVRALAVRLSTRSTVAEQVDVRVVRHQPEITDSTALSLEALAPHTDGAFLAAPPRLFLLSCSRADDGGGGASTLIPVEAIAEAAAPWALQALCTASYRFLMTYDGDLSTSHVGPVLTRNGNGAWRIRWRADHIYLPAVVEARGTRAHDAAMWLRDFLGAAEPITHVLQAGEVLLVPNSRMVHGRRALSSDSRRELLRAWIF
jgi:alpha-ketoglutarate-dependent taurine dioxygenase